MRIRLNALAALVAAAALGAPAAAVGGVRPTRLEEIPVPDGGRFQVQGESRNDLGGGKLEVRTQYTGIAPAKGDPIAALKAVARFYEERFGVKCAPRPRGAERAPEGPPSAEAPVTCEGDSGGGLGVGFRWAAKGPDGLASWELGLMFGSMAHAKTVEWTVLRLGTMSAGAVKAPGVAEMGMPAFPGATFDATQSGSYGGVATYRFTTAAAPQAVAKFYEGALKKKLMCVVPDMCMGADSRLVIKRDAGSPTEIMITAQPKR
jgi:hypothetical protein